MSISNLIQEKIILLDGGMGTQIFSHNPTVEDYGGVQYEGCVELLNIHRPQWIKSIHAKYFEAGADAVETNSFGSNKIVLSEFGLENRSIELNRVAAQLAKEVALDFGPNKYVVGSIGPGTKILTLLQTSYDVMYKSYYDQALGLIQGGSDVLLIETSQDLAQIKCAVRACKNAMKQNSKELPLWVQVTIESNGTMLVGSDIQAALTTIQALGVNVIGMNCATGPQEMRPHLAYLSHASDIPVSCLPNAGLPLNVDGNTVYPLQPKEFAKEVFEIARQFSLNILGGCCGTTPEHIKELSSAISVLSPPQRNIQSNERFVSSLYSSVSLNLNPGPVYVGERTNANGSKKFKDLLSNDDFDGCVEIAKEQQKEGAHILDVCVAYVSRNEMLDMKNFLEKLVTQVNLPLMIDSTEVNVIEQALQIAPGKCIVNSINFEDGEEKCRQILTLCKEYGAAVVALTIDEAGMAKTVEDKVKICDRIYNLVVNEFKIHPGDLIIDPLTFTLGSGDEEFRESALNTIVAIKDIKTKYPSVKTILGLSNVSFGLKPQARQILNSLMLFHSVQAGLDLAILNSSKIVPMSKINTEDKKHYEDLLFNRKSEGYDPLKVILQRMELGSKNIQTVSENIENISIEEKLKRNIIDGEKIKISANCLEAIKKHEPLFVINSILLEGMKIVGERFGSGEMQLPFVLESAEAMKTAVKTLEPFLEKKGSFTKGKVLLATVKGDVHDIGKNLVEIILSNNGFEVVNLGIKQPIESILEAYKNSGADLIGLSGLLVKSTVIMKENLDYMNAQGFSVPVILGGAALTRKFVETDCQNVYPRGLVTYAQDAFEGLKICEFVCSNKNLALPELQAYFKQNSVGSNESKITILKKGESNISIDEFGHSSWVRPCQIKTPPFWGLRHETIHLDSAFAFLDEFALLRSRWGFTQGKQTDKEFEAILNEKAYPKFTELKKYLFSCKDIKPKVARGYFPCVSEKNKLLVFNPLKTDLAKTPLSQIENKVAEFILPRQQGGRRLCISDFYSDINSGAFDTLSLQLVSLGDEFTKETDALYAQNSFSDYFYLHGLGTELTEALAELTHKTIRAELNAHERDSKNIRQIFSQGYQGSRYSFGYPACPDMEGNLIVCQLLESEKIGVQVSESYQMQPELSTCALITVHPQARYFSL
jgi:5-methyltetrahydrofolate--homocysteine methyltransferase